MKRGILSLFVGVLLVVGVMWSVGVAAATERVVIEQVVEPVQAVVGVRDLEMEETRVAFDLVVPRWEVVDGLVVVDGLNSRLSEAGAPDLPVYQTWVVLPPGAEVEVAVEVGAIERRGGVAVRPGATAVLPAQREETVTLNEIGWGYERDETIYKRDGLYPGQWYHVSKPQYYRDVRMVQLTLYPVRYEGKGGELVQVREMGVTVNFVGGEMTGRGASAVSGGYDAGLAEVVVNHAQIDGWRQLPPPTDSFTNTLPTGIDSYRIEVAETGIYEVSYADLQAAGMDVANVDPNTLGLWHRGVQVAYQWVGDGDSLFESGEAVRFYGWAFDGPRLETQHVNNNVFWLWADPAVVPTRIMTGTNELTHPLKTSFIDTITAEQDGVWFPTWSNEWDSFDNEPEAIYWWYLQKTTAVTTSAKYPVALFNPVSSGTTATYTVEFMSQNGPLVGGSYQPHKMTVYVDTARNYNSMRTWQGIRNVNIRGNMPNSVLVEGLNYFDLEMGTVTASYARDKIYVNRVTVDYERETEGVNDWLVIEDNGGARRFEVGNFSVGDEGDVLVWDIGDRWWPRAVPVTGTAIVDEGGTYRYRFGADDVLGEKAVYLVTNETVVQSPVSVVQYVGEDLSPVGGAEWVAISYGDFISEAMTLAAHRADPQFGGLSTHVVDIFDVQQQYGWGLPLPTAINSYLLAGLYEWPVAPNYLVLVGDATINPRKLSLNNLARGDDPLVPTHILYKDRFQGQIPADTGFSYLIGEEGGDPSTPYPEVVDLWPDMAVGRIPAQNVTEASNMVNKIILYEQNQLAPEAWQNEILFVSDNSDAGGQFCNENLETSQLLPTQFNQTHLCLPNNSGAATTALRQEMYNTIGVTGTLILNYRGHGSVVSWASPAIAGTGDYSLWANIDRPMVILSADCLDGYFAVPGRPGLGETFFKYNDRGSAAHWSSSGLGFSFEHTILHEGFYKGLFEEGITRIGDTVNWAKVGYVVDGRGHEAELWSFTLLGDPAMHVMRPDAAVVKEAVETTAEAGDLLTYTLTISNQGVMPTPMVVTDTLPLLTSYVGMTASAEVTTTVVGGQVRVELGDVVEWGEQVVVTLTLVLSTGAESGVIVNTAEVVGGLGADMVAGNNVDTAEVTVGSCVPGPLAPVVGEIVYGGGITLNWSGDGTTYEVYRRTAPYGMGGGAYATGLTGLTFVDPDPGVTGDVNTNYFYTVRSLDCAEIGVVDSQEMGVFDFG
ncbi:MAG TPA: C25 family cysteine peptidase, partial [Anaerolineae bacterium]|nr:C25 family cysteine peptidase [Anaerolineae bacterium]